MARFDDFTDDEREALKDALATRILDMQQWSDFREVDDRHPERHARTVERYGQLQSLLLEAG